MGTKQKYNRLILFSIMLLAFALPKSNAQSNDFEKVDSNNFKNLYKLNDSLYRSEQPSKKGMKELEIMGMESILNLRRRNTDKRKLKGTDLHLKRIPLKAGELDFEDIFNVLYSIQQAKKPVLVHCWHGSDRTGAIIAASRMVFEDWSRERAITEFTDGRFGYHKNMYPNLLTLLESIDVALLKEKLKQGRR